MTQAGVHSRCYRSRPQTALRVKQLVINLWAFSPFQPAPKNGHSILVKKPQPISVGSSLERLRSIVPLMQNVGTLYLRVHDFPTPTDLVPLFKTLWDVYGSRLLRLWLQMHLVAWEAFLDSKPSLRCLTRLEASLVVSKSEANDLASSRQIIFSVASFVNSLASHIQALKLQMQIDSEFRIRYCLPRELCSSFSSSFTTLASHRRPFAVLQSLSLCIPFTPELQEHPSGLSNFLLKVSHTIRNASIRIILPTVLHTEQALLWLEDLTSNPLCFSQVTNLTIEPTNRKIIQQCISNSCKQLTALTLIDNHWNTSDFLDLSTSLSACQHLSVLQIDVYPMGEENFDWFARNLPKVHCVYFNRERHTSQPDLAWPHD
jgi:hypothetical protein